MSRDPQQIQLGQRGRKGVAKEEAKRRQQEEKDRRVLALEMLGTFNLDQFVLLPFVSCVWITSIYFVLYSSVSEIVDYGYTRCST